MADNEKVIVHERSGGGGTALAIVLVIALLVVLFFVFGGTRLFTDGGTETVNVHVSGVTDSGAGGK